MSKFTVREIPRFMLLFITLNENIWKKMHRITHVLRQLQENGAALTPESVLPSPLTMHDITSSLPQVPHGHHRNQSQKAGIDTKVDEYYFLITSV